MEICGPVRRKTMLPLVVVCMVAIVSGCSSDAATDEGETLESPKTPAAVFEAQSELYGALFEDPPEVNVAVSLMSASCQGDSPGSDEVLNVVLAEVELAKSADISKESVLSIFSEISYTIEGDVASGDDGSEWVYEDGGWRSTDC